MNFGEKLTSLRKQKGLSQEELGYQLNVTRQTVSKWELGQTTPEMDKLVEMSKIFGVTVDELTNESELNSNEVEKIEDKPINDKPQNNATLKVILIIIAVFIIGGIIVYSIVFSKFFSFGKGLFNKVDEGFDEAKSIIDMVKDEANKEFNKSDEAKEEVDKSNELFKEKYDEAKNMFNEKEEEFEEEQEKRENEFELEQFNSQFEHYSTFSQGFHLKNLLDEIVASNQKNKDKIVTVVYKNQNYTEAEEIKNLKNNFENHIEYEFLLEYNENGYVNKLVIY